MHQYFLNNLNQWSNQNIPYDWHLDVVVSDVLGTPEFRRLLALDLENRNTANKRFWSVQFNENNPVYVTFNLCIKHFNKTGEYDYYIYCSEDCVMSSASDLVTIIRDSKYHPNTGHVSVLVDNDNTNSYHHYNAYDPNGHPMIVALTESINMHFSVWTNFFMKKYDFKYVDIINAYATESIYTFLNAAIGTKWVHCRKVRLQHQRCHKQKGYLGYDTFRNFRDLESIFGPGVPLGLGFECWMDMIPEERKKAKPWDPLRFCHMPNRKAYSKETGECKQPEKLYQYIKENLFVPKSVFDYDQEINKIHVIPQEKASAKN